MIPTQVSVAMTRNLNSKSVPGNLASLAHNVPKSRCQIPCENKCNYCQVSLESDTLAQGNHNQKVLSALCEHSTVFHSPRGQAIPHFSSECGFCITFLNDTDQLPKQKQCG
jgi:hypothetical protein